jgi:UDP-N-acetylglucosamine acyltransferase
MATVHPNAILEGEIDLADDVEIGPHCVLRGEIAIGPGTRLIGGVWLQGPLTIGESNVVYPGACLGFAPQDYKWDPRKPGAGLVIGSGNIFREGVTIHRATSEEKPTTIGDRTMFMANSHVGHDCRMGNHCVFANCTALGGHVTVGDRVVTGGGAMVHQFCQLGRGAMLGGILAARQDVPPFFMLTDMNVIGAVNVIGMRRSAMPAEDIQDVRWVYKTLYRRGWSLRKAVEQLRTRAERPLVREYIEFIGGTKRGLCGGPAGARHRHASGEAAIEPADV